MHNTLTQEIVKTLCPTSKQKQKHSAFFLKLHKRKCLVNFFTQMKRCCEDPIPYGAMWPATFEPLQWGECAVFWNTHRNGHLCISSIPPPIAGGRDYIFRASVLSTALHAQCKSNILFPKVPGSCSRSDLSRWSTIPVPLGACQ